MTAADTTPGSGAGALTEAYSGGGEPASPDLSGFLLERIAAGGPLPFHAFMGAALYHPEWGYYGRGGGQVGRRGDFFTSVSAGPLFGRLLARRLLGWWEDEGRPRAWRAIEAGAHDGTLAADILEELRALQPEAFAGLEYAVCEPLPRLRAAQREKLAGFAGKAVVFETPADLARRPLPGLVFGNEVLDALPCHRLVKAADGWRELLVDAAEDGGFRWREGGRIGPGHVLAEDLAAALAGRDGEIPPGYRSELRTREEWRGFFSPLLAGLERGLMCWIDYGFAAQEYYHPARTDGTLRAYARHCAVSDPLAEPGRNDLTAHVDFTAAARAAAELGAPPAVFRSQGTWLTELARPALLAMEGAPDPVWLRNFQTLTHPAQLGARFFVLECAWNGTPAASLPAADRHRLAWDAPAG